jgi:hypothetical protein
MTSHTHTLIASRPRAGRLAVPVIAALLVTVAVYAAALGVVRRPPFGRHPDMLAAALAFDLVVTVPLAYWWLLVRPGHAHARTLLPALALSVAGAKLVLPAGHQGLLGAVRYVTAPLELLLVGYAVVGVRRALRRRHEAALDVPEALAVGLVRALGDRGAAHVIAAELATVYYALLAGRRDHPGAAGEAGAVGEGTAATFAPGDAFPSALAWGLALVAAVEGAVLHLLLAHAHPRLAWTLTALTAYSVLWIAGHRRAAVRRPCTLDGRAVTLRAGLRLTARLDVAAIAAVERPTWHTRPTRTATYLDAARPSAPNVVLTLRRPCVVTGALGLRRAVTGIGLALADPDAFVTAVRQETARSGDVPPSGGPRSTDAA